MRAFIAGLCLTLSTLAAPAAAQTPDRSYALTSDDACPVTLPPGNWTEAENWAWNQICLSRWTDMRRAAPDVADDLPCNPAEIEGEIPAHRTLSSEFFQVVLTRADMVEALAVHRISLNCAYLPQRLSLENAIIAPTFLLSDGYLPRGANFIGAQFERLLGFSGSTFDEKFDASRMSVAGGLFLRGRASFKAVDLRGASIEGNLEADGSKFEGKFNADGMSVRGDLFLRGGASFQEVNLLGGKIGGSLSAIGSTFEGKFIADRLSVGGSLFLRGGASFQEMELNGTKIGGTVQMLGGTFSGIFNFSNSTAQEIALSYSANAQSGEQSVPDDPKWGPDARLILRNAEVEALQSRPQSWKQGGDWIKADLSGFSYDRLSGFRADDADTMLGADADELEAWLEGTRLNIQRYDPQPYQQLAAVLEEAGMSAKGDAIRFAKFRHRDDVQPGRWWETWFLRPASRFVIGYGVYPFRALWWFAGLVLVGFAVAFASRATLIEPVHRKFWYSLENALPLVEFNEAHKTLNHGRWQVESWFHFQKVMGFVLATVLVGALSLLGG